MIDLYQTISNPQLRHMSQIAFPQLLFINVVVDIYGLLSYISAKLLDELARHSCAPQMSCEPVATAMRREMVLHAF